MKNLTIYFINGVLSVLVILISLKYLFVSFSEVSYFGVFIWSLIISIETDMLISRHKNFMKYYPYFEDKWL
jgi:hypothetical protein